MGKKIIFKTASMIRNPQEQPIPADVTKRIDDWIMSNPDNNPLNVNEALENKNISLPATQENRTIRLNINISSETHKEIKKVCVDRGVSITDFVTNLLQREIGSP